MLPVNRAPYHRPDWHNVAVADAHTEAKNGNRTPSGLWNDHVADERYRDDTEAYHAALLHQYRLYVEMADRISQRRALANTFFLTANTALATVLGAVGASLQRQPAWSLAIPLIAVLGLCGAWFSLLRSYRLLNGAKYAVIADLEERMPASPYRAEWQAAGEGRDWRKYWPLTHIEKWIPLLFALLYLGIFLAVTLT